MVFNVLNDLFFLQGFRNHVKNEHSQWAYIFFFIHLNETRPNDYTALELYISRLVSYKQILYFMCLHSM